MFQQTDTKEIKKLLVAEFGHPFSVRRDRGTASHWISVSWRDGPTTGMVNAFCRKFNDTAHDDLMTDLWCGGQYTNESREFSLPAFLWAVHGVETCYGIRLRVTIIDSWRGKGEKTGYIKREDDQVVDPDNPDGSQQDASSKVNRLLWDTDLRKIDLSSYTVEARGLPSRMVREGDRC